RVAAADQVSRPDAHPGRGVATVLAAEHIGVELAQPLGVGLGRTPHDESIAEIPSHDSVRVGRGHAIVNRPRATVASMSRHAGPPRADDEPTVPEPTYAER